MLLALNCGSSSIKFKLFQFSDLSVLISGSATRVDVRGQKPVIKVIVHHRDARHEEREREEEEEHMEYDAVFQRIIELIEASVSKHFQSSSDGSRPMKVRDVIKIVTHRIVHGGIETQPMTIWPGHEQNLAKLDKLGQFAPLHNHRAVEIVKSCLEHLPESRQVLLFDTLFHQTIEPHIYTYPLTAPARAPFIPLRKYGAHGLSYASVLSSMSSYLGKPASHISMIVAHLGSGASVCAIRDGKSLDTSMGLTPLDGLPGGTRSGSVDPALIFHHTKDAASDVDYKGTNLSKGEMVLNKEGGFQALSGTSDFGVISFRATSSPVAGNEGPSQAERDAAKLTYDLFIDRILNYIGAYVFKILGGSPSGSSNPESRLLDGIVFSGGIGEKGGQLRRDLGAYFAWLGSGVDNARNEAVGKERDENGKEKVVYEISKEGSKVKLFVCMTDEETQCAIMAKELEID